MDNAMCRINRPGGMLVQPLVKCVILCTKTRKWYIPNMYFNGRVSMY